jgi:hypothetical protein
VLNLNEALLIARRLVSPRYIYYDVFRPISYSINTGIPLTHLGARLLQNCNRSSSCSISIKTLISSCNLPTLFTAYVLRFDMPRPNEFLATPKPTPDLHIPASDSMVDVSIIDT